MSTFTPFQPTLLRGAVVLPGAFVEGALAVLLPWTIAAAALHSIWLGVAAAAIVAAPLLGTLAAPVLAAKLGSRRLTVTAAIVAFLCLCGAALAWGFGHGLWAFLFALAALSADTAADLAFATRLPVLARLSGQSLVAFSNDNWLWGLPAAAMGSVLTGLAISSGWLGALIAVLVVASALVAAGLAVLLPRESRTPSKPGAGLARLIVPEFWTRPALLIAVSLSAIAFFVGPMDNLLLPSHLAARHQPASLFGYLAGAAVIGMTLGLAVARVSWVQARRRALPSIGLLAMAGQIGLLLWLPPTLPLILGVLVSSALYAPLLPIVEAALIKASPAADRALLLAGVGVFVSVADVAGTMTLGAVAGRLGTEVALTSALIGVATGTLIAAWRTWGTPR